MRLMKGKKTGKKCKPPLWTLEDALNRKKCPYACSRTAREEVFFFEENWKLGEIHKRETIGNMNLSLSTLPQKGKKKTVKKKK